MDMLIAQAAAARDAARVLAVAGQTRKNAALSRMADYILKDEAAILEVNRTDLKAAREKGLKESFIERLTLNPARIAQMAEGLRDVVRLPDPVGEVIGGGTRPSGLSIIKKRVPLGVIGIIYESRPNVTVDAAALCLKSGNAVILRGGSDAIHTNTALMASLRRAARDEGFPEDCVSLVADTSRETVMRMMRLNGYIDVLIPRGGKELIDSVVNNATVPVVETGIGICHVYVDKAADLDMARAIAVSAKVSRPSVCNAAETLLISAAVADTFLPGCLDELHEKGVEVRGCPRTQALRGYVLPASEQDYSTEYCALIYNVRVVDSIDDAIAHITAHGTRHSEAIVTGDLAAARRFQDEVDAAAVYVNASTRFTDGAEFGYGAEIGISNQKLHARGPMGLPELTTVKYLIMGDGHTR